MKDGTFFLEVQDDGSVDGGDGEVGEGAVLQLHVQSDRAQVRLPAQRPHGLKHRRQTHKAAVGILWGLKSSKTLMRGNNCNHEDMILEM